MAAMASSICRENVALSRKNTFHVYKIISRENYLTRNQRKIHCTNFISDPKEQVNYLAESFFKNSSSQNYSKSIQKIKHRKEQNPTNFSSDN